MRRNGCGGKATKGEREGLGGGRSDGGERGRGKGIVPSLGGEFGGGGKDRR